MQVKKCAKKIVRKLRFKNKVLQSSLAAIFTNVNFFIENFLNPRHIFKKQIKDIQIILDPVHKGWVIEKLAKKIIEFWKGSTTPDLYNFPRSNYKLTHWMHFMNVPIKYLEYSNNINTIQITHVDSNQKAKYLQKLVKLGAIPVFMSDHHFNQVTKMIDVPFVKHVILPASDVSLQVNQKRILISSNYYPDGRKNEGFLIKLSNEISLDNYHFTIIGKSWESIALNLIKAGAKVKIYSPDDIGYPSYEMQLEFLRGMDCYIYLGFDEGSLGALDAYLCAVPMIVSKQGFHLEFKQFENLFFFETYEEFRSAFMEISRKSRFGVDEIQKWSWYSFSSDYQKLWEALISEKKY